MGVKVKIKTTLTGEDARKQMPASEIMKDFRAGTLHSGKGGPIVKSKKQAKAIQISYARKEGHNIPKKPDASGSNYVSRNDLALPAGATPGKTKGSERVPYKKVAEAGDRPCGACEDRRKLNDQREARTKLGRGKPAIVEVE